MTLLVVVLVGWPAIFTSLSLMALAIVKSRPALAVPAVLLGTPFLVYLFLSVRFRSLAPVAMVAWLAVPIALAYRRNLIAATCAAPYAALAATAAWFAVRSWS